MSIHEPHPPARMRPHNPPRHRIGPVSMTSRMELAAIVAFFMFSLIAPALVVSPGETGAEPSRVLTAVALTLLGVVGATGTAWLAFRRTRNYAWLIIGFIPSFTLLSGAAVLAATTSGR
ncbi:MAG: hypothetical protein ACRCTR_03065 [Actinomycetota bacterium]